MTNYTVRVELHDAESTDYENLHAEMIKQGFSRTIVVDGVVYHLPTAEYSLRENGTTRDAVLARAEKAANKVQPKPQPSILVTASEKARRFSGLKKA